MNGFFTANKTTVEYNTKTHKTIKYSTKMKYEISKIAKSQYLMKQSDLTSNDIIYILFVKRGKGYISASYQSGIDNLFIDDKCNLIHSWSDNENSSGVLINAYAKLKKVK